MIDWDKRSRINWIMVALCFFIILEHYCDFIKTPFDPETYIIPETVWEYAGITQEEVVQSIRELGDGNYTDVKVVDQNVEVELSEIERNILIRRNDEYLDELVKYYKAYNFEYRYVGDENYQQLKLYFDEKIPHSLYVKIVHYLPAVYGMNYILKNNTEDWNVEICVYNCHTNKLVVSANAPYETVTCGPDEWKASYEE